MTPTTTPISKAPSEDRCTHPYHDRETVDRLRAALPPRADVERSATLLRALGNGTRLRIVHALARGEEMCVCDVAHLLGSTVSKASHHLRRLREAGVVDFRSDGRMAYYYLAEPRAADIVETLLPEPAAETV